MRAQPDIQVPCFNTISGIGNSKKQRRFFFRSAFFFVLQKCPFPRDLSIVDHTDLGKSSL